MTKKKKNAKDTFDIFKNPSMRLFAMFCGYLLLVLVLYTIFQFIKFKNCLGLVQILSILIPLLVYVYYANKGKVKENIIIISIYLLFLLIAPFVWGKIPDLSWDGNMYHKVAVAYIKNGWNPLYETSKEFSNNNKNVVEIPQDSDTDVWIEHYPKGTWIIGAAIYEMTDSVESGKVVSIYLLVMLLIISFNCLRTIIDKKWAGLISLLVCANPIMIYQVFTYYIDGLMGICFVIELLLLFLINPLQKQKLLIWISLAAICNLYTNIKFTGLLCSGLLAAIFYFYWFFKYKKEKDFYLRFRNITLHFVIVFVTAIFIVGANSYAKNTIEHHHPLYPLFGEGKYDIITGQQPKSFKTKSSLEKFMLSTFSKTENVSALTRGKPMLKVPFRIYRTELDHLSEPDPRIGGFGPLFALVLIISLLFLPISIFLFVKNEKKNIKFIVIPSLAIFLSMLLIGECWWARYIPQFYLVAIGSLVLIVYTSKYYKKEIIPKIMSFILTMTILANISLFAPATLKYILNFRLISKDIYMISQMDNPKIEISSPDLSGAFYNLKDCNIKFTQVEELNPEQTERYYNGYFLVSKEENSGV